MENNDKHFKRYTVTTALPYANGPVHIGHLAGVYIPADTYVRYLRMKGEEVLFVGGSDEHGVPITIKAEKEGCTPQDIVDRYHNIIKDSFEKLGISYDIYSRTSSKTHHETAAAFFKKLYEEGKFIERIFDYIVISIDDILRSTSFFFSFDSDRHAVFIGATDKQNLFAFHS